MKRFYFLLLSFIFSISFFNFFVFAESDTQYEIVLKDPKYLAQTEQEEYFFNFSDIQNLYGVESILLNYSNENYILENYDLDGTREDFLWFGHLQDKSGFSTLMVSENRIRGYITTPKFTFNFFTVDEASYKILVSENSSTPKIDLLGEDELSVKIEDNKSDFVMKDFDIDEGDSDIRVHFFYTESARAFIGGVQNIYDEIELSVVDTNQIFENSSIPTKITLTGATFIPSSDLDETTLNTVLWDEGLSIHDSNGALSNRSDGIIDYVQEIKDFHKADEIILIVHYAADNPNICGVPGTTIDIDCINGYAGGTPLYPFSHEFGHRVGAQHNVGLGGIEFMGDVHGLLNEAEGWRTIMAKDRQHDCCAISAIPYYSDPFMVHPATGSTIGDVTCCNVADLMRRNYTLLSNQNIGTGNAIYYKSVESFIEGIYSYNGYEWEKIYTGLHGYGNDVLEIEDNGNLYILTESGDIYEYDGMPTRWTKIAESNYGRKPVKIEVDSGNLYRVDDDGVIYRYNGINPMIGWYSIYNPRLSTYHHITLDIEASGNMDFYKIYEYDGLGYFDEKKSDGTWNALGGSMNLSNYDFFSTDSRLYFRSNIGTLYKYTYDSTGTKVMYGLANTVDKVVAVGDNLYGRDSITRRLKYNPTNSGYSWTTIDTANDVIDFQINENGLYKLDSDWTIRKYENAPYVWRDIISIVNPAHQNSDLEIYIKEENAN